MIVYVFDFFLIEERVKKIGVNSCLFEEVFESVDIIIVYMFLIKEIKGLLNKEMIVKMKKGVCLINCVWGGIIDEVVFLEVLESGYVVGVVLDVFEVELLVDNKFVDYLLVIVIFYLGVLMKEV